jgi:hypothetical protein
VTRLVLRDLDELAQAELGIAGGRLTPPPRPLLEVRQEQAQEGRLELVEAGVVAHELEVVLVARTMEGEHPDPLGQLFVVRGHQSSVAEAEEVFGRVEAEGRGERLGDPGRPEGLGSVLDQRRL